MGILIAINFNQLDANRQVHKHLKVAFQNILSEVKENKAELDSMEMQHRPILALFARMLPLYSESEFIVTTRQNMQDIYQKYPKMVDIVDSTLLEGDTFQYEVDLDLDVRTAELNDVSWETTKALGLIQKVDFDCSKKIIKLYSLQNTFLEEQKKIFDIILEQDVKKLQIQLNILSQLRARLLKRYEKLHVEVEACENI